MMKWTAYLPVCIRMTLILIVSCVSTAVSCPHPSSEPEPVDPTDVTATKSSELRDFENKYREGLYIKGESIVSYDEDTFQKAVNRDRMNYRIQSDDQKTYMNITWSGDVPAAEGDECACTVVYCADEGDQTMLIVKFVTVKVSGDYGWLWNELQKVGVIIPLT